MGQVQAVGNLAQEPQGSLAQPAFGPIPEGGGPDQQPRDKPGADQAVLMKRPRQRQQPEIPVEDESGSGA